MTETTEKIVESYFRFCRDCATMTNIKCSGQHEIDLLAINLKKGVRYHVESSVHITPGFSRLTSKPFDPQLLKDRVKGPSMRRTLGFFDQVKFDAPDVRSKLTEYGFTAGSYRKVIVTWDCDHDVRAAAEKAGIEIVEFPALLEQLKGSIGDRETYIMDDTIRALQLFAVAEKKGNRK